MGVDFERVAPNAGPTRPLLCPIKASGFGGNRVGTYLFNLIRLARNRETFAIIYLDPDHSSCVDLIVAIAAVLL